MNNMSETNTSRKGYFSNRRRREKLLEYDMLHISSDSDINYDLSFDSEDSDRFNYDIPVDNTNNYSSSTEGSDSEYDSDSQYNDDIDNFIKHVNTTIEQESFLDQIKSWVIKNRISRETTNELLSILKNNGHSIPSDYRTILNIPKSIETQSKCGGKYIYILV